VAALVAAWLAVRPGPAHVADAEQWLRDSPMSGQIMAGLRGVLMQLWPQAWKAGAEAAGEKAGDFRHIPDVVVADRISRMASRWLQEVADTRIRRLAAILAAGGTPAELEAAVRAMLASGPDARMIGITEISRAMQLAAMEVYRAAGVVKVRWQTRSGNPCPVCLANEAAGPRYLGEAFPSGSVSPPEHPNCECALVPADGE
jgi:hypothetical protein